MNVIFQNRDFSEKTAQTELATVNRLGWKAIGGPDKASLSMPAGIDRWEAMKLLRCPVRIYADDGSIVWWGFVSRVSVPHGEIKIGLTLDKMTNSVAVHYANLPDGNQTPNSAPLTTWANDFVSQAEYGIKERIYQLSQGNETQANARRDTLFSRNRYPVATVDLSGGTDQISIDCQGWWNTLDWRYYSDSNTDSLATTSQIQNILVARGQFLDGVTILNESGISSNRNRDGRETALHIIEELLASGTNLGQRMLAQITQERRALIHIPTDTQYLVRQDGRIETNLGIVQPAWKNICGAWAMVKDAPPVLGGYAALQPFLIESMEYAPDLDKVTYRAAGEYDQILMIGDE